MWQQPGFRFLPLGPDGAALWPPGYVPRPAGGLPTPAQTESRLQQHERVEANRQAGRGWAGGTLNLPRTPHNPAPATQPLLQSATPRYVVLPTSVVWRALELIRYHGRPIQVAELAADMRRPVNNVRAAVQPWLERGVLRRVDGGVARNGAQRSDLALGRYVHRVHGKAGA